MPTDDDDDDDSSDDLAPETGCAHLMPELFVKATRQLHRGRGHLADIAAAIDDHSDPVVRELFYANRALATSIDALIDDLRGELHVIRRG